MSVLDACTPRPEVLNGPLEDALFAADFGHLIAGTAPPVYLDPRQFFQNTHPTTRLKDVVRTVFHTLAEDEAGTTVSLSTGFGGGKTHTLMCLHHLAKHVSDATVGVELLPLASRPKAIRVAAIDASKAGRPVFVRHADCETRSLWGELAYQLGGKAAWDRVHKVDDPAQQPDEALIQQMFGPEPTLILLDELVIYYSILQDNEGRSLVAFLNKLASVVQSRKNTVLVVTDTRDQTLYANQAIDIQRALQGARAIGAMLGRVASGVDPIGNEGAQVIVRRLFSNVDSMAAQRTAKVYKDLFDRVNREHGPSLPSGTTPKSVSEEILQTYPFHPQLLWTAQDRLSALQDFNRSRGILRLFARMIRSVWSARTPVELIGSGDVDWSDGTIQADLLARLSRTQFSAAISADIDRHARELDGGGRGLHVRTASALLLASIPALDQANAGLTRQELCYAVLTPADAGPEPGEALDRLVGICWHTYPIPGGNGYQFRYEPNVVKQIEDRISTIQYEDARGYVHAAAQKFFAGPQFRLYNWPQNCQQVPDDPTLRKLVLCDDEDTAARICAYSNDRDPTALVPRQYPTTLLAVAPRKDLYEKAIQQARRLKALEAVKEEHKRGNQSAAALVRDQIAKLEPTYQKSFALDAMRAFSVLVLPSGRTYRLDETALAPEDGGSLSQPRGQSAVMAFLQTHSRDGIYLTQALDPERFVTLVLPGAVPVEGQPGVCSARSVLQRLLGIRELGLVAEEKVVSDSILRALEAGKTVLRDESGTAYSKEKVVAGQAGARKEVPARTVPLRLDDSVWICPAGSEAAAQWLKVDPPPEGGTGPGGGPGGGPGAGGGPGPGEKGPVGAGWLPKVIYNWPDIAAALEAGRSIQELRITSTLPAEARNLLPLVSPLGAAGITLTCTVSGTLKGGGALSFSLEDVKPTHPVQPLDTMLKYENALDREGLSYMFEATLRLSFNAGAGTVTAARIRDVEANASPSLNVQATFASED